MGNVLITVVLIMSGDSTYVSENSTSIKQHLTFVELQQAKLQAIIGSGLSKKILARHENLKKSILKYFSLINLTSDRQKEFSYNL